MSTASRTSGPAPLAVFFDATSPAGGVVQPADGVYARYEYEWDFGDPSSGTFTTSGKSRNTAAGYVAAHVFEQPGTYRVSLRVLSPAGEASYYQDIVVQPFTGPTFHASSSSGRDSHDGRSPAAAFASVAKGVSMLSTGSRLLLRRGDTFTVGSTLQLPSGTLLGTYGSGPPPILDYRGTGVILNLSATFNVTVMDLRLWSNPSAAPMAYGAYNTSNLLLLRVANEGCGMGAFYGDSHFIVDSTCTDSPLVNLFVHGSRFALLGSTLDVALDGHNILADLVQGGVIASNVVHRPGYTTGGSRACLWLASNLDTTRNVVISDNRFDGEGAGALATVALGITSGSWDPSQHGENILFERNVVRGAPTLLAIQGDYAHVYVRRNTFEQPSPVGTVLVVSPHSDVPDSRDGPSPLLFYNNTITSATGWWSVLTAPRLDGTFIYQNTVNGVPVPGNPPPGLLPGDIDASMAVDVLDVIAVVNAFASKIGDSAWDPRCDFDGDGQVDVVDVITVVQAFGQRL